MSKREPHVAIEKFAAPGLFASREMITMRFATDDPESMYSIIDIDHYTFSGESRVEKGRIMIRTAMVATLGLENAPVAAVGIIVQNIEGVTQPYIKSLVPLPKTFKGTDSSAFAFWPWASAKSTTRRIVAVSDGMIHRFNVNMTDGIISAEWKRSGKKLPRSGAGSRLCIGSYDDSHASLVYPISDGALAFVRVKHAKFEPDAVGFAEFTEPIIAFEHVSDGWLVTTGKSMLLLDLTYEKKADNHFYNYSTVDEQHMNNPPNNARIETHGNISFKLLGCTYAGESNYYSTVSVRWPNVVAVVDDRYENGRFVNAIVQRIRYNAEDKKFEEPESVVQSPVPIQDVAPTDPAAEAMVIVSDKSTAHKESKVFKNSPGVVVWTGTGGSRWEAPFQKGAINPPPLRLVVPHTNGPLSFYVYDGIRLAVYVHDQFVTRKAPPIFNVSLRFTLILGFVALILSYFMELW